MCMLTLFRMEVFDFTWLRDSLIESAHRHNNAVPVPTKNGE